MQIIIPPKRFTIGERGRAMEYELRTGMEFMKAREKKRELVAAEDAKTTQGMKEIKGLGRCVATMPSWEFFRLHQKYGHKELHSREFLGYFQKKFPHLAPNKL